VLFDARLSFKSAVNWTERRSTIGAAGSRDANVTELEMRGWENTNEKRQDKWPPPCQPPGASNDDNADGGGGGGGDDGGVMVRGQGSHVPRVWRDKCENVSQLVGQIHRAASSLSTATRRSSTWRGNQTEPRLTPRTVLTRYHFFSLRSMSVFVFVFYYFFWFYGLY